MLQAENTLFTVAVIGYFILTILNFAFVILKKEKLAKAAFYLQAGIFILHTAALVLRGIGTGHWPMTNQYEFSTSFAWALCLVSLVFIRKYRFPVLGAFSSPLILLMIGYAAMQSREVRELMPSLRSSWLAFHVSTAIIAYGAFGVTCVLSMIFLFRGRIKEEGFWGQHIPDPEKLDMISYRSVSLEIGPEKAMEMTAEGGPDDHGHVFGAGMGITPYVDTVSSDLWIHCPMRKEI